MDGTSETRSGCETPPAPCQRAAEPATDLEPDLLLVLTSHIFAYNIIFSPCVYASSLATVTLVPLQCRF